MPVIASVSVGKVTAIWGNALVRLPDGSTRVLKLGDIVRKGEVILTRQDSIVEIRNDDGQVWNTAEGQLIPETDAPVRQATTPVPAEIDRVIQALNQDDPEAATAAGAPQGGGEAAPALRVDRIAEASGSPLTGIEVPRIATPTSDIVDLSGPGTLQTGNLPPVVTPPGGTVVTAGSSAIQAQEEGASIGLALPAPASSGSGAITVTVTALPTIGEIRTAAGTVVAVGDVLSTSLLQGLVYVPPADYVAGSPVGDFVYTATDGSSVAQGRTTIGMTAVNDQPVAIGEGSMAAPVMTVAQGSGPSSPITVLTNDTDADGDPLTVVSASSPNGSVTINPDDTLVFTPTPGYSGPATITYTISDGQGGSSTASVHLAVSANNAPIAVDDGSAATPLVSVAEDSGASAPITVLGNDSDPDGHPLGVIAATSPNGTVTINANGTLSFTPAANFNGPTTISYTISDGQGGTATATVHVAVTPVNDAPVATDDGTAASPLLTVPEDSGASAPITVLANDTDVDGDPLAVVAATSPNGTVTINPDGSLSFTPAANFSGPTTISYTVSDGQGGTSTATVHVAVTPVNDAPVATDDGSVASPLLTVAEDSGASAPITVLANDTDVDGDPLTVVAATSPNGAVTINADGTLSFTPAANFSGPTTISYTISDGQGGTSTATVHVAVTPDNDGPTAVDDGTPAAPALTVAEDSGASAPITVLANDTDDDGDPLSIIAATSPNGTVTINPDGTLSFTPAANFNGPTTISYTISDGEGGSSTAVVHVAVTPVNDAPVAQPAAAVVAEDAPVLTGNVVATDVDAGAVLSFALTGGAPAGLAFNPDGSFAFDPSNAAYQSLGVGQSVVLTMPYTVTDDQGATSTANLVITVTGTNDAPVAQAASFSVAEDGAPISGTVVATDVDANAVLGFALTGAAPAGLSFNADGSYSFDPSNAAYQSLGAGQSVLITVPYRVTDDQGASSIANLVITVTGSNDAPVAQAASFSVAEDAPVVNGSVAATDSDGNATLSYALVGAAPAGLVFNADGSYAFDASAAPYQSLGVGQSTVLTVSYRVTDDQGATSTANLVITVTGTNDAPVAQAASVLTSEGAAVLTGAVVGTDIDANAALSYALVGSAPAGLVFGSDGSYSFDPSNAAYQSLGTGQSQVITVPYRVTDDQGATSTANLVITITGSNDAPVAQAASFSVAEDAAVVSGAVVATDADANAVLGFALNGAAPAGLTFNADGSYSFNPANAAYQSLGTGQSQVITVPYTVTDDQGATSTANLVITVTGTNDAPVAQAASFAVAEDAPTISGAVSASDIDANATLSFGLVGAAPAGLTFNADGSYSFDPSNAAYQSLGAGQSTVITVPYRVTDDQGASSIANLVITVTGSNDAPVAQAASFSVAEDAAVVTGAVVATDTDAGATLSYALVGAAPAGLVFASSGSYSFDPSNAAYQSLGVGQSQVITVPYRVTDDQGATSTANLVITITGTNDAPVAQAASFSVAEDATIVSGTVVATGVDANAVLGFALNGAAPAGLTFNGDGSYSFDATNATYQSLGVGQSVVLTVPYTVTDDQGATSTANLVITITGSNDAPVAQAAARTVAEDAAPIGGSVVATDTDANAALSYALNGAAPAGLVFAASGSYSFDPSNAAYQSLGVGQSVVLTVPYTVTDDQGATSTANLVITVTGTNDAPVAGAASVTVAEDGAPISGAVAASDVDANAVLGFALNGAAPAGLVFNADGSYSFNPANAAYQSLGVGQSVVLTVPYTVTDDQGATSTANLVITVTGSNDAPVAQAASFSVAEDATVVNGAVVATDTDANAALSYALNGAAPAGLVFASSGSYSFDPSNAAYQSLGVGQSVVLTVPYTVTDDQGATSTANLVITVTGSNDAPLAQAAARTVAEDAAPISGSVVATDVDANATLGYALVGAAPAGLTFNADGSYSFDPSNAAYQSLGVGQSQVITVPYRVTDDQGATSTANLVITVTGSNDAPLASAASFSVAEDAATISGAVSASDVDANATLSFALNGAAPAGLSFNADGSYSFNPANAAYQSLGVGQSAVLTVPYTVTDDQGATSTANLVITITGTNDAPVAGAASFTVAEGALPVTGSVTATDIDANTVLSYSLNGAAPAGLVFNSDGSYSFDASNAAYEPLAVGQSVVLTVPYTVTDDQGATSTANLVITVTGTNGGPVAQPESFSVAEDAAIVNGNVVASDPDGTGGLSYALVGVAPAGLVFNADGSYSFNPANAAYQSLGVGQSQVLSLSYTVTDDQGESSTASFVITVTGTNDGPVAAAASFSVAEDAAIVSGNVVATDIDANAVLGYSLNGAAPAGLSFNADGSYSFNAANAAYQSLGAGQSVVLTVPYTVTDDQGATSTANLVITVTGANDAPVAVASSFSVAEDAAVVSGSVTATDADGNASLGYALNGAAPAGLVFNADGSYSFDPANAAYQSLGVGQSAVLTVPYTVTDDQGATSTANLVITITGTNDAPVAQAAAFSVAEDAPVVTGSVLATDVDANATLTFALVGAAPAGLVFNADGSYSFDASNPAYQSLAAGQSQVVTVPYRVTDDQGATSTANLVITVTGTNDGPVAQPAAFTVAEDAAVVSGNVVAVDPDAGPAPSYGLVGGAPAGLTFNADGSYSFNPGNAAYQSLAAGQSQVITVPYRVTDDQGATSTANLVITITGSNDAPVAGAASFTVAEDAATISGAVSATDADTGAVLSFALNGAAPAGLVFNADGSYSFNPANAAYQSLGVGQSAVLTVPYTVTDDQGASSTSNLVITVTGTNDAPVAQAAARTVAEDAAPISGTVVATDIDANAALTFALVGAAPAGLAFASSGAYSFDPSNAAYQSLGVGQSVVITVPYRVTDDQGATSTANLVITVTGSNDAPVAQAASFSVAEDAPIVSGNVVATDIDAGASLSYALVGAAPAGLSFNADGSYSFNPANAAYQSLAAGQTQVITVPYRVTDDQGATSTANLVITITGTNDAPVAVADVGTTPEDTPVSGNVLGNDTDVDAGATLAVTQFTVAGVAGTFTAGSTATIAGVGTLTIAASGAYTFTPAANYNGSVPVASYTVSDGTATATGTLTLTVSPVNDAPVAVADTRTVAEDATVTATAATGVLSNDTDADAGDTRTVSAFSFGATPGTVGSALVATYGTLTLNADGSYSYAATGAAAQSLGVGQSATEVFSYTARDAAGATSTTTLTFTITGTNDAPVAQAAARTVAEDAAPISGSVVATDVDANAVLSYALTGSAPAGLTFASSGSYSFDPSNAAYQSLGVGQSQVITVPYRVTDDQGATSTANLVITITGTNDAPVAAVDSATTAEDNALTLSPATLLANDTDIDAGTTLTITSVQGAVNGTVALVGGNVVFTPAANYNGPASFTYTVSDGNGATSTATVAVSVTPVNDAPVAVADTRAVAEDATVTATAATGVLANDTDVDAGDTRSVSAFSFGATPGTVGSALVATYGTLTLNADGSYSYVATRPASQALAAGQTATEVFSYTARDAAGATSTTTLTFTITGTNDAPVAVADVGTTPEDTPVSGNVLGNDTDVDAGATLAVTQFTVAGVAGTFTAGSTATIAGVGTLTIAASGAYTFTPAANYNGSVPVASYTVSDGTATATGTLTLTVSPVNDAPVAVADTATTNEDTALTIAPATLLANDTDVDGNPLTIQSVQGAVNGTVALVGGNVVFTPAANYNGPASFTYTVSDGQGGTSTATVNVTVVAVNDAPVNTVPAAQTTAEDSALVFSSANGNALSVADVDGGSLTVTVAVTNGSFTLGSTAGVTVTGNGSGSVQLVGSAAAINAALAGSSYVNTADYNGGATLTLTTSDGSLSDTDTVAITVSPVVDIAADSVTTSEDTPITISVLANDSFENAGRSISAVNGTAITAGGASVSVTNGSVALNASGQLIFTPAANYNGAASFTYTVSSGGVTETATVNVTVTPVNDAPVAVADTRAVAEDATVTATAATGVLANDTDVDAGDTRSVSAFSFGATPGTVGSALVATYGTLTLNADGSYSYVATRPASQALAAGQTATEVFSYTARDAAGATSTTTLTFTITGTNDAPVAVADVGTTPEDTPVSGNVLGNDTDVDAGATLAVTQFTVAGVAGTFTAGSTATIAGVGTLTIAASGAYTFTPAANYNGSVPVASYTVSDGTATATGTLTLTVSPVNDAPVTVADTATAVEAGGVGNAIAGTNPAGNVLTNDTDVDAGDTRSVSAFSFGATSGTVGTGLAGAYGTLTLNADGSYSYVVNNANAAVQALRTAANTLTEVFTYTVRDAAGATSSTTLTVTIQGSNDAPVATADTGSLLENATLATTAATGVLANDTDVDSSDTRSVSAVSFGVTGGTVGTALNGTYGTLTLNADGSYSYSASRPAAEALVAGQVVTEQFSYTVRDTAGATSTATLTFTVTGANDAPTITGTSTGSVTEDTTLSSSGTLTVVDPDAGQSSFVAQTGSTGTYGSFSITTGGAWTYTLNNAAANVQTLAGGTSVSDSFTVTTADGTTRTVVVTVNGTNDAPVATADSLTVNEDNAATGNVLTNDSDVDLGATLAVTQFTVAGVSGTFAAGSTAVIAGVGTLLIAASGAYTFTPVANYNGSVPVATYTVSDGAATATATLSLTVSPVNDAPVNTVPAAQSTLEDTNRVFSTANGNAITVADVDSASVTTTLTVANGTLTLGSTSGVTVSGNGSGTVTVTGSPAAINAALNGTTFQPTANYSGTTSLTVTTNDGSLTDTDSVAITVTPVADVPTLVLSTRSATTSFASSGETAPNTSTTSESILTNPFEGWTRVDGPDAYAGGTNAIEVWTTGDTQQRQDGNSNTIVASAGNGDNFIELNNAATLVQTLGLSRTVSTQVGMVYDLSLDYAGRPGFGTDFTRIGVYLDGVLIQQYSATSPQTYIDWKSLSFAFVGDGADHVLTIRTDASQFNTAGRGAFIDDVRLEGTQGVVAGNAGSGTLTSVALATFVTAPLVDGDGSESLSLIFSGVPAGAVIVTSANPGGYAASGGSITISGAELASAQLQFSSSITGHLSLGVTATATETANGATATNSGSLELDVLPVFTAADIGGDGLNNIIGTTGTDTLNGTGGADYLIGRAGNDTLSAAGGADYLDGGAGNDSLNGGGGNDVLYGGAGNDALTGGTGADVFAWTFGDQGSAGTPATDTIADFNNAAGGDVLDLRDLLVGENAANLSNYLHFTTDGTNTTITVSSAGNGSTDQIIQLSNVNLVAGFSNDTQIINDLLARGKLITDGS